MQQVLFNVGYFEDLLTLEPLPAKLECCVYAWCSLVGQAGYIACSICPYWWVRLVMRVYLRLAHRKGGLLVTAFCFFKLGVLSNIICCFHLFTIAYPCFVLIWGLLKMHVVLKKSRFWFWKEYVIQLVLVWIFLHMLVVR